MARAGRNAKEIMVPKIEVTGLGRLHAQRGLQDGLDHLRVRDQDVQLRPRHQAARGRHGRGGGGRPRLLRGRRLRAAAHAGGAGGGRLHVLRDRGARGRDAPDGGLRRRRGRGRAGEPARRDERDGRGGGDDREPHPLHHADAQGRAGRLLAGETRRAATACSSASADRGGAADALLQRDRAELRRRGPVRVLAHTRAAT